MQMILYWAFAHPVSAIARASGLKWQGSSSPRPLATVTAVTFVYWSVSIEQVQWRVFACLSHRETPGLGDKIDLKKVALDFVL
jgi:hypothetical protein